MTAIDPNSAKEDPWCTDFRAFLDSVSPAAIFLSDKTDKKKCHEGTSLIKRILTHSKSTFSTYAKIKLTFEIVESDYGFEDIISCYAIGSHEKGVSVNVMKLLMRYGGNAVSKIIEKIAASPNQVYLYNRLSELTAFGPVDEKALYVSADTMLNLMKPRDSETSMSVATFPALDALYTHCPAGERQKLRNTLTSNPEIMNTIFNRPILMEDGVATFVVFAGLSDVFEKNNIYFKQFKEERISELNSALAIMKQLNE